MLPMRAAVPVVERACEWCKATFRIKEYRRDRFCSRPCLYAFLQRLNTGRKGRRRWQQCSLCGQRTLSAGVNGRIACKRCKTFTCEICGKRKSAPTPSQARRRRFCSLKCWARGVRHPVGADHYSWQGRDVVSQTSVNWRAIRRSVLARDKETCSDCGTKPKPIIIRQVPLVVHHVNGRHDDRLIEDDPTDLITLCRSCHTKRHRKEHRQVKENSQDYL